MMEQFETSRSQQNGSFLSLRVLLLLAVLFGLCSGLSGGSAWAQAQFPGPRRDKDRNPQKNLTGQVVDKTAKGLPEAVVYLKDKKSLEVKTHIADEKGEYRFSGLDPNSDYEVHAEFKGSSSAKRNVSSFDDRKDPYLVLQIEGAQ